MSSLAPLPLALFLFTCAACAPTVAKHAASPAPLREKQTMRLPRDVRPTAQRLVLHLDPATDRYHGTVEIDVVLDAPRDRVWLHARGPRITRASATSSGAAAISATFQADGDAGLGALHLAQPLPAGPARLTIEFDAPWGPRLEGLYKVVQGGASYAFTQFEPTGARYAFPCFDEPGWKIPWDTTLVVPDGLTAIANTRELAREQEGGAVRIHFAPTQALPSYLIAFAVGPLEIVPAPDVPPNAVRKRPLPLRAVTARGRSKEVAYALAHTGELLAALELFVGHEYPYDKLDIIAVPDKGGAMENPGAITFNDYLLLFDEAKAPLAQRRRYASVMAHELAHQWTGNLVTAAWWNDIWLNEAFATWLGTGAADRWNPKLEAGSDLFDSIQLAMGSDALVSARAIRQPIASTNDIENGFDIITYRKGGGVLAMFERWVGPDRFRLGLTDYLAAHRHGTATADDFLDAVSARAGKDVKTPFHTFLDQPGVPFVEAEVKCDGAPRLALRQSRFFPVGSTGDPKKTWQIPICVRYAAAGKIEEACTLLSTAEGSLPLGPTCPTWVFPNADAAGYYRYALKEPDLANLRRSGYALLTARERIAYAGSLHAAFTRGTLPMQALLLAATPLAADPDHSVAAEPMALITQAREWFYDDPLRAAIEGWGRRLLAPQLRTLGWRPVRDDDTNRVQLQVSVLSFLTTIVRDPAVRAEALGLGLAWLGEGKDGKIHPEAISRDLVWVALAVVGEEADRARWDRVHVLLASSDDAQRRANLLTVLANARRPELVPVARALALDPTLRATEVMTPLVAQMQEPALRDATWTWVKAHFDEILAVAPKHHTPTALIGLGAVFCDEAHAADLEAFFTPARIAQIEGGPRVLAATLETVRLCVARRRVQEPSARAFFRSPQAP